MSFQVAAHQTEKYRVHTGVYEGPLDLLLDLIERAELDVTSLALAQVTDQYLAYLRSMEERNAAEVSAFLVIASRLLLIKSSALLPRPTIKTGGEPEEDPGEALARQLLLYKQFKEKAYWLADREEKGLRSYLRVAPPPVKVDARFDLTGLTLKDLTLAARSIMISKKDLENLSRVVSRPRVTIREKIRSILNALQVLGKTKFHTLLKTKDDRFEVVVTFLALLELVKRQVAEASQRELFSEIEIQSTGIWDEKEENDLDFVE
ncbi:MAG TPA: segregation/condensation protein A [Anaerolineaceae bacterium]